MGCKPRMAGCAASCLHRRLVEEYRCAREYDEAKREYETRLFKGELELYQGQMITFKQWLKGSSQRYERESAA